MDREPVLKTPPVWVAIATSHHETEPCSNDVTYMYRAFESADFLSQCSVKIPIHSIAVIGVGFDDFGLFVQSVIPPVRAARMENLGIKDFTMTLVDTDTRLHHVAKKQHLYGALNGDIKKGIWNTYLQETHQDDRIVLVPEVDLEISDLRKRSYISNGVVHAALTPPIYRKKLEEGSIQTIITDVAQGGWAKPESMQYLDCRHVLMHMSNPDAQALSMWQLSLALAKNGFLVIDDRTRIKLNVLLKKNAGWMDKEFLHELRLTDVTHSFKNIPEGTYILKKG